MDALGKMLDEIEVYCNRWYSDWGNQGSMTRHCLSGPYRVVEEREVHISSHSKQVGVITRVRHIKGEGRW